MLEQHLLTQIVERIQQGGLVALLRNDQLLDRLLEVGDALLASPILAIAVSMQHPEVGALLRAYRLRFGDHLLLGASPISTIAEGTMALAAGADFLITTRYDTEMHHLTTQCGALYIPPATMPAAIPALQKMDLLMATVNTQSLLGDSVWPADSTVALLAMQDVTLENIACCAKAGAAAAVVDSALMPTTAWSMPTMIRTARALRHAWFQATTTPFLNSPCNYEG